MALSRRPPLPTVAISSRVVEHLRRVPAAPQGPRDLQFFEATADRVVVLVLEPTAQLALEGRVRCRDGWFGVAPRLALQTRPGVAVDGMRGLYEIVPPLVAALAQHLDRFVDTTSSAPMSVIVSGPHLPPRVEPLTDPAPPEAA